MDKRYTLKQNYEFRRLYDKGKNAPTQYLVVYARRSGRASNRVGYTVSKKLGKAVVRNRIRRRLREIYRLSLPQLRAGYDIVIVARSKCVGAEYRQLEAAFLNACGRLGLLK